MREPGGVTIRISGNVCLDMLAVFAVAAVTQCQARSIGPGTLRRGGTAGAACLMAAFDDTCRAADYTLSAYGVDTVHSLEFRTERRSTGCAVLVTESYRVIPQTPHVTARRTCARVHKTAAGIVADRCTPARTISLTKLS
jgi:hypothetical protein